MPKHCQFVRLVIYSIVSVYNSIIVFVPVKLGSHSLGATDSASQAGAFEAACRQRDGEMMSWSMKSSKDVFTKTGTVQRGGPQPMGFGNSLFPSY